MTHRSSLKLWNTSAHPLRIVLEPYATEFMLPVGSTCEVIGRCEEAIPEVSIEYTNAGVVFWGQTGGAVYEYWQDGALVD